MVRSVFEAILLIIVNALTIGGLLIRFIPHVVAVVRYLAQLVLSLSVFACRLLLTRLAPFAARLGIDLVNSPWRVVATSVLSLALGAAVLLVARYQLTPTWMIGFVVYGLLVGIVWDNLGPPTGLTLGV